MNQLLPEANSRRATDRGKERHVVAQTQLCGRPHNWEILMQLDGFIEPSLGDLDVGSQAGDDLIAIAGTVPVRQDVRIENPADLPLGADLLTFHGQTGALLALLEEAEDLVSEGGVGGRNGGVGHGCTSSWDRNQPGILIGHLLVRRHPSGAAIYRRLDPACCVVISSLCVVVPGS